MSEYEEWQAPLRMPCGGTAYFDEDSGISHRCELCGAVVGSIGMPRQCKSEVDKWNNWKTLGGQGWDYQHGKPKVLQKS